MDDPIIEVAARLYAVPPETFVAVRAEEVARARKAGDAALAAAVSRLRKPTVAAWLVNLLAHRRPDLIAELFGLGDELRAAQRELRGAELRELSVRRRSTVHALAIEAAELAGRDNPPLADVEHTLAAALADPDVAASVRAGQLTRAMEYTGFGETPRPQLRLLQGGQDAPAPATSTTSRAQGSPADSSTVGTSTPARSTARADEQHKREEARKRAEARRQAEEEHARVAKQARRELLAASQQLDQAQLAKAEAVRAVAAAEKAIRTAEKRVALAKAALSELSH